MLLLKGVSNDIIAENIRTLKNEGKSVAQATAMAYKKAGRVATKVKAVAKKVAKHPNANKLSIKKS